MLKNIFSNFGSTFLLLGAIISGSMIGYFSPDTGEALGGYVDYTILALVSILFLEVRFEALTKIINNLRFLAIAWLANFILIPTIGFLIATLFLSGKPLFFTGLLIYFIAPCTDWFLGFTRLAGGNTTLGAGLIPVNMVSQLLLYPVYLSIFAKEEVGVDMATMGDTLLDWFLIPFVAAIVVRLVSKNLLSESAFEGFLTIVGKTVTLVIATLVLFIFSANINTILSHVGIFAYILVAVFIFFIVTFFLGELISKMTKLDRPEHVLLTMTTAARNAPLMLGLTAAALPDQPLIYAALVIGMLVEFPHLIALKHLLLKKA